MDKFIEQIANGDFSALLSLITTLFAGGFGTALTIIAGKFAKYKASVNELVGKVEDKVIPAVKETINDAKNGIVEDLRKDIKVLAESMALMLNKDADSKLAIVNNISKIGVSEETLKVVEETVKEEVIAKEEKKEKLKKAVKELENNSIETL